MTRHNPDSPENLRATRDNERYVASLKLQKDMSDLCHCCFWRTLRTDLCRVSWLDSCGDKLRGWVCPECVEHLRLKGRLVD